MMNKRLTGWSVLMLVAILVCFPTTAHAYFDPGTGSMILQILGIAFISMGGLFITFKNRILAFFGKAPKPSEEDLDADEDEQSEAVSEEERQNDDSGT